MAFQEPIKYFNSFWLKKAVGDTQANPEDTIVAAGGTYDYESTVTTTVKGGWTNGNYILPTWPGVPWGDELSQPNPGNVNVLKNYPCFPFGGRDWNSYTGGLTLPSCGGSLIGRNPTVEIGFERNWFVEEARIRGGFNNTTVDFGAKAYLVEDENLQQHRFNTLIYSGIYNSRTGVNNTNLFSTAEGSITKSVDPESGSIQKLYAYNTNLTIFQENKVSKALIDKDAIYSAEGEGTPVTSLKVVIGQIVPYAGEFGISTNPESWAQFGLRQYFSDRFRSCILRLSRDGLTQISSYGMTDYFRDTLATVNDTQIRSLLSYSYSNDQSIDDSIILFEISNNEDCPCENIKIGSYISINGVEIPNIFVVNVQSGGNNCTITASQRWKPSTYGLSGWPKSIQFISYNKDKIIGGFDTYNQNYVISIQDYESSTSCNPNINYDTLSFDEAINGWVSFYDYKPVFIDSLKNNFYSSNNFELYQHYVDTVNNRANFYGVQYDSRIEFIFNPQPSMVKNFQTVSYEGTNGWEVSSMYSDFTEKLHPYNSLLSWFSTGDLIKKIHSYTEGEYINPNTQMPAYGGFYLKENKYCANLINNSPPFNGEVVFGASMSGIKGYFTTIAMKTDNTTDVGGMKELYAVSSKYVKSSE